ncbi:MAG: PrsW family intramembrane metalloprotease [Alicyclobacillus sp.]|nr:PrsW family intramembrane metalloprotease [Alicyclobacillus sp.]
MYALFAVLPACLLMIWLYTRDRLHPEPKRRVLSLYVRGAAIVFPAGLIERIMLDSNTWTWLTELNVPVVLVTGFFVAGMVEEFLKASIVERGALRRGWVHTPIDAIVYAGATALGFATVENILYCTHGGVATVVLRAVTAVPAHLMFGIWMGSYFARVNEDPSARWKAYIVPALAHGTYDTFALSTNWLADLILFGYLLFLLEGSLRRVDRAIRPSRRRPQRVS